MKTVYLELRAIKGEDFLILRVPYDKKLIQEVKKHRVFGGILKKNTGIRGGQFRKFR